MLHGTVLHAVQERQMSHPFFSVQYAGSRLEIWIPYLGPLDVRDHIRFRTRICVAGSQVDLYRFHFLLQLSFTRERLAYKVK